MTLLALLTGLLAARPPSSPSQPSGPAASWLSVSAFASPLPLVVLAARQPIPNEPKADALLVVSGCGNDPKSGSWRCCLACEDQPAAFWGPAGAELRGRSSQAVDKKSYNLELRATEGGSAPASLLGMPAHEDWVLYGPSLDRSLVRDALAYELARLQGRWAPRYRFVELFVLDDGSTMLDTSRHYRGVYMVSEPVSRGEYRVNVTKLDRTDASSTDLSGGYIFELANAAAEQWWAGQLGETQPAAAARLGPTRVDFKYPKASKVPSGSWSYASSLFANVDAAIRQLPHASSSPSNNSNKDRNGNGNAAADLLLQGGGLVDVASWVDFLLGSELSCDYDAYVSSVFLHKDRGGPLVAGPVWDKNLAFGNEVSVASAPGCGWRYASAEVLNSGHMAEWYGSLAYAGWWRQAVATRWQVLRDPGGGSWSDGALAELVSTLAGQVAGDAAARNFNRWPLGSTSTNNRFVTVPPAKGSWEEEVGALRSWLLSRARWLDSHLGVDGSATSTSGGGAGLPAVAPGGGDGLAAVFGAVRNGRPVGRAFAEQQGMLVGGGVGGGGGGAIMPHWRNP